MTIAAIVPQQSSATPEDQSSVFVLSSPYAVPFSLPLLTGMFRFCFDSELSAMLLQTLPIVTHRPMLAKAA